MFEHSIYEAEPQPTPLHEGDLFYHYELPNWQLGPRIYKILGISAVANLLIFFVFTATPILTMKGCDSPFVGSVCQVLDTLYVGSKVFGTDRDYVDAVYDKTKIGDADVTFVDVTGDTPPLDYPEGYFQIANPDEFAALQAAANDPNGASSGTIPGIPPGIALSTPDQGAALFNTPQHLPKSNPKAVEGPLPSGFGTDDNAVATNNGKKGGKKGGTPDASPSPSPSPEVGPSPMSTDAMSAVQINKRPLTDFADQVVTQWTTKQIDLNQNFTIVLNGYITPDGKLDTNKSRFDVKKESGDPKMINIGKEAFQALGETGMLSYLKSAGIDQITAVLIQDDQNLTVQISSPQKTPEMANKISSAVAFAIMFGKTRVQNPSDELTLLTAAQASTDGKKNFVLNFVLPKPVAQEMITRKLQEAQAKKAQPQPSSESNTRPNNNTAQK